MIIGVILYFFTSFIAVDISIIKQGTSSIKRKNIQLLLLFLLLSYIGIINHPNNWSYNTVIRLPNICHLFIGTNVLFMPYQSLKISTKEQIQYCLFLQPLHCILHSLYPILILHLPVLHFSQIDMSLFL